MCGIAGYFDKRPGGQASVGGLILSMLTALERRGPDSAGVALYGASPGVVLRTKLGESGDLVKRATAVTNLVRTFAKVTNQQIQDRFLRLVVDSLQDVRCLERAIESVHPDIELVSAGRCLELVKQVGTPADLETSFAVSQFKGTHGIGHTRLSTESRVDLSHSQPFWSHGTLDLSLVHNGHITNYHKLRRQYEQNGIRFYTDNDSEIIGIYLSRQMESGLGFEEALLSSLDDLDGSFSYVAATATSFGYARDCFCLKPLIVTENDAFVAIATEEIALNHTFTEKLDSREPTNKHVRVWTVPGKSENSDA